MIKPERAPFAHLYRISLWQDRAAVPDVDGKLPLVSYAEMRQTIWSYGELTNGNIEDMIDGCNGRLTIEIGKDSDKYDFVIVGEIYRARRIHVSMTERYHGYEASVEIDRVPVGNLQLWNNHVVVVWDRAITMAKQMIDKGEV